MAVTPEGDVTVGVRNGCILDRPGSRESTEIFCCERKMFTYNNTVWD